MYLVVDHRTYVLNFKLLHVTLSTVVHCVDIFTALTMSAVYNRQFS